jgi:hypothetical protein
LYKKIAEIINTKDEIAHFYECSKRFGGSDQLIQLELMKTGLEYDTLYRS